MKGQNIKERISRQMLCILLSLAMVITMMPVISGGVYAAEPSGTPLEKDLTTSVNLQGYHELSTGTYYLSGNTTGNIQIQSGATVTLDLNGYVLKAATNPKSVIQNLGNLTIVDSNTSGAIHYFTYNHDKPWEYIGDNASGAVTLDQLMSGSVTPTSGSTVVEINGGCITGGQGTVENQQVHGGGICNNTYLSTDAASLTVEDGYIIGNGSTAAIENADGIEIESKQSGWNDGRTRSAGIGAMGNGTVTMTGGTIVGNACMLEGAAAFAEGTHTSTNKYNVASFKMTGGLICYNVSSAYGPGAIGGGGNVTLAGGNITKNYCAPLSGDGQGAVSYVNLTVGGTVTITGNKDKEENEANLYIYKDKKINISNPSAAMNIGVSSQVTPTAESPVYFTENNGTDYSQYFYSDSKSYAVFNVNNALCLKPHTHSWKYIASGSDIETYCDGAQCSQSAISADTALKRTLLASDTTYNGSPVKATLTNNDTWDKLAAASYGPATSSEITYQKKTGDNSWGTATNTAPIAAGTYKASVTVGGATASVIFTISKADQGSITAPTAKAITYNKTGQELVNGGSATNGTMYYALGRSSTATPTSWSTTIPTATNAGTYYVWYKSVGDDDHNDTVPACMTATIEKKVVNLEWSNTSLTYNGKPQMPKASATNLESGDACAVTVVGTQTDTNAKTGVDKYVATATKLSNDNYQLSTATDKFTTAFTIGKKTVTATGTSILDKVYDGTKDATATNATLTDTISGDSIDVKATATFINKNASTTSIPVNVFYELTGDDALNYELATSTAVLSAKISQKQLKATGTSVENKVYDGTTVATATNYSLVGVVDGDKDKVSVEAFASFTNASAGENKATTVVYTISGDESSNYIAPVTDTSLKATIEQLEAVLSWGPLSFTYDGKGHLPEATVTNLIGSDTCIVSVVGTQTNANAKSSTTDYTATATKLSNANYKLPASRTNTFTIVPKTVGIDWSNLSLTYNGKEQKPTAVATQLVEGEKCTVTVDGAKIDSNVKSSTTNYIATATALSDANYTLPSDNSVITHTFTIAQKVASLKWGTYEFTYDGENHLPVASISNLQRSTDNPSVTVEGAQKNTNKYSKTDSYTATATELADKNYVLSTDVDKFTHKFTIGAKTVGLDWSNLSLTYNGKAQKPNASATKIVGSDTCLVTVTGEQTNAGSYTATAAGLSNDNYQLPKVVTKAFTIAKKLITVSAGSYKVSKVYDSTTGPGEPSGDISVSGILAQDSNVYVKKGIIPRYQSQDVGTYSLTLPVTLEGDTDNNYKLNIKSIQVPGTITQKTIHVSADDQTSYVEEELNNLTYTSDELLGSDTFSGRLETNADKYNPGTYTIKQGSLTAGKNYKIEFQDGTYTVEDDEAEASLIASAHAYKKSIRLTWTETDEQATYRVYIANCNKKNWKLVKTTTASAYTKKSLKAKTSYKMYVAAYDEDGKLIAKTPVVHCMTTGGKYSNATSVQATLNMTLTAGEVSYVDAKITKKSSKKTLLWKKHCAKIRYYSADNDVATVDADGNVTAVGQGIVNIYSVAPSGAFAVTTVKVINN